MQDAGEISPELQKLIEMFKEEGQWDSESEAEA